MRLRFSRRADDIAGAAACTAVSAICLCIVATFPAGAQGDGVIQPIFAVLAAYGTLVGLDLALDGPVIRRLIR